MSPRLLPASLAPAIVVLAACSGDNALGVKPGGAQDNAYAEDIVARGGIPSREHFSAEGIFSEHDLPLPEGVCDQILCPAGAATPFAPVDGTGEQVLVQVGFDTVLTADTFERRPLNVAVAVDVSGSMSDGKLDAVRDALHVMVDQLDERDHMALVAFDDSAWTVRDLTVMDAGGRDAMNVSINRLEEDGGTNIEAGLDVAYDHVEPGAGASGIEHRVLLFTDAQPNVGNTDRSSFLGMAQHYSEAGIGLSLFGVGLDMGTELADALGKTRGGSYHFLATHEDIRQVFDEEFDYIVTPVAYDLDVEVRPADGVALYAGWGAPVDDGADRLNLGASTLFLGKRNGGMGVSLVGEALAAMEPGSPLATFDLTYEEPDGALVSDSVTVAWNGGTTLGGVEVLADAEGVYKMAGLVDEYLAFTAGADFCEGALSPGDAEARIVAAAAHLGVIADVLGDVPIAEDEALLGELLDNLRENGEAACAPADTHRY